MARPESLAPEAARHAPLGQVTGTRRGSKLKALVLLPALAACAACAQTPPPAPAATEATRTTQTINPCANYEGVQGRVIEVKIYPDTSVTPGPDAEPVVEPNTVCLARGKKESVQWKWVGQTPTPPEFTIEFARRSPFAKKKYSRRDSTSDAPAADAFPGRVYGYSVSVPGFGASRGVVVVVR